MKRLPENWMKYVTWSFPTMDELDENSHQDAISKMLQNHTSTYKEILGNDWREKLLQSKEEINWFKENGLAHPSYNMISGGDKCWIGRRTMKIYKLNVDTSKPVRQVVNIPVDT